MKVDQLGKEINKSVPDKILTRIYGKKYQEYREAWDNAGTDGKVSPFPLHINVEVNYGCNYKCMGCVYHVSLEERNWIPDEKLVIDFEKYKALVDEGVSKGLYSISLNGTNEPLMFRELPKYIKYAVDAGIMDVSFHTNGALMTEERADAILDTGLTSVMFSLDAFREETYNVVRQARKLDKVYEKILRFIEKRNERGQQLPLVKVSFVVSKVNVCDLEEFCEFWKDKVEWITLQEFSNPFVGRKNYVSAEDSMRIIHPDEAIFDECGEPWRRLYIGNDGKVYPCCSFYGYELEIGNVYEETLEQIWHGRRMKRLRQIVNEDMEKQPIPCLKCRLGTVSRDHIRKKGIDHLLQKVTLFT